MIVSSTNGYRSLIWIIIVHWNKQQNVLNLRDYFVSHQENIKDSHSLFSHIQGSIFYIFIEKSICLKICVASEKYLSYLKLGIMIMKTGLILIYFLIFSK